MTTLATHNPQASTTGDTLFVAFLVSHKFSVQPGGIEFTLPDEGELKT